MAVVALKPMSSQAPTPDGYVYYDMITFSSGSPPDRPRPPPGGGGGGGPVDPGYSPPWAQLPVDPGYGIDIGGGYHPPGGGGGGSDLPGTQVRILPIPPSDPPVPPPAGMAPGATQVIVFMGPGTKPTTGWINPYASTGPVEPPPPPAPAKK